MSNLIGADGKPIESRQIPCVMWNGHTLPIRVLSREEAVQEKGSVNPMEVIREMRAGYREMQDRFTLLSVGLAVLAKKNPGGELDKYLSEIGITLKDMSGNTIYEPAPQYARNNQAPSES